MRARVPGLLLTVVAGSGFVGAGCGRVGYQSIAVEADGGDGSIADGGPGDGGPGDGGPGDGGPGDGGPMRCDWSAGPPAFGAPAKVPGVNSPSDEGNPVPSADELLLAFSSARTGGGDFYVASRATRADAFGAPVAISELNSAQRESKIAFTGDRLDAVFASTRMVGMGLADLFEATRTSMSTPFVSISSLSGLNTPSDELDPFLVADGLLLLFAPQGRAGGMGLQDLFSTTRANATAPFAAPTPLANVNTASVEADPSMTGDGLVLVFASDRSGTSDLYYATRASTAVDFGAPLPIASVNTAGDELDPYVSDDGCSLYFVMDPVGDPNAGEIFVVRRP